MTDQEFWCFECGTTRNKLESVSEIKNDVGLCRFCNADLEQELGKGSREIKKVKTYRLSE